MDILNIKDFFEHEPRPLFTWQRSADEVCLVQARAQAWTEPTFWLLFLIVGTPLSLLSFSAILKAQRPHHVLATLAYFFFAGALPVLWGLIFLIRGQLRKRREGRSVLRFRAPAQFQSGPFHAVLEIPKALPSWRQGQALLVATPPLEESRAGRFEHLEPGEEYCPEWAELFAISDEQVQIQNDRTQIQLSFRLPEAVEEIPPVHQFRVQIQASVRHLSFDATFELPNQSQVTRRPELERPHGI